MPPEVNTISQPGRTSSYVCEYFLAEIIFNFMENNVSFSSNSITMLFKPCIYLQLYTSPLENGNDMYAYTRTYVWTYACNCCVDQARKQIKRKGEEEDAELLVPYRASSATTGILTVLALG